LVRVISPLAVLGTQAHNVTLHTYDERDLRIATTRDAGAPKCRLASMTSTATGT